MLCITAAAAIKTYFPVRFYIKNTIKGGKTKTYHKSSPSGNPKSPLNCGNDTVTNPLSIDPMPVTKVVERIIIAVPLLEVTGSVLVAVLSRFDSKV